MRQVLIYIPGDCGELSPNQTVKMHWGTKAKLVKRWKAAAEVAWLDLEEPPFTGKVRLTAVVYRHRVMDPSNAAKSLAIKGAEDGLVAAGMIPDDSAKYVEWGEVSCRFGMQLPRLEILVEEIGLDSADGGPGE